MGKETIKDSDLLPIVGLINYVNRNLFQRKLYDEPLYKDLFYENLFLLSASNATLIIPIVFSAVWGLSELEAKLHPCKDLQN